MKKILAFILVLVSVITLSGCMFVPKYWDGLTKKQAQEYVQSALQEKYGEEFKVLKTYLRGGTWNRSSELMADCSPKADSDIIFEIESYRIGDNRILRDTYIQSIVRQEMMDQIYPVMIKYFDKFAVEVNVKGLLDEYDSGIRSAENATIKNYSEAIPDSNKTHIWVVLNEKEMGSEKIDNAVKEMVEDFYSTYAYIDFYYATDDTINQCIKEINDGTADRRWTSVIVEGRFPYDAFIYEGNDGGELFHVVFANK